MCLLSCVPWVCHADEFKTRTGQTERGSLSMALNLLSHVCTHRHTQTRKCLGVLGNVLYGVRHLTTCGVSCIFKCTYVSQVLIHILHVSIYITLHRWKCTHTHVHTCTHTHTHTHTYTVQHTEVVHTLSKELERRIWRLVQWCIGMYIRPSTILALNTHQLAVGNPWMQCIKYTPLFMIHNTYTHNT